MTSLVRRGQKAVGAAMRVVENNQEQHRYLLFVQGDLAGFVQYSMSEDELWVHHVQLKRRYKSEEMIEYLLLHVVGDVHRRRLALMPFCPAMRLFLADRPKFTSLVPPLWHARFLTGLQTPYRPMDHVRYTGSPKRRTSAEIRAQSEGPSAPKTNATAFEARYLSQPFTT
ncbi:hypothetical protein ACX80R_18445 [Paeniglutamicibacter antarcticus]